MKKHREIAMILTLRLVGSQENGSGEGSEICQETRCHERIEAYLLEMGIGVNQKGR